MSAYENGKIELCKLKVRKEITKSNIVKNLIGNLLFPIGERIINEFVLTLTNDYLYAEAIRYSQWGGLKETAYTDQFPIEDIQSIEVKNEEAKEIIKIVVRKKGKVEELHFYRNNEKGDNLAFEMEQLFKSEIKDHQQQIALSSAKA